MLRLLLALVLFASCSTPKKLNKLMNKLPEASAKECSQRFPIKESTDTLLVIDTNLLRAYEDEYNRLNSVIADLVNKGCDTIYRDKIKEIIKQLPSKTETKYIVKTQESTAKLQVIKDSCNALIEECVRETVKKDEALFKAQYRLSQVKDTRDLLWLVVVVMGIIILRKPLTKMFFA
jgi:hypothetical protein